MFRRRDPVCKAQVSRKSEYFFKYNGRIYYFDCQACKATFQENPDRYLKRESNNKFLKWLTRGSSKVPRSCHERKI